MPDSLCVPVSSVFSMLWVKPCHAGSVVCSMPPTSGWSSSTTFSLSTVWSLPNWWEEDWFSKVLNNNGVEYVKRGFSVSSSKSNHRHKKKLDPKGLHPQEITFSSHKTNLNNRALANWEVVDRIMVSVKHALRSQYKETCIPVKSYFFFLLLPLHFLLLSLFVFFPPGFPLSTLSVLLVTYCGVQLVKERERQQALLDEPEPVKPVDGGKEKAE